MKRIYDRNEVMARFRKEYNAHAIAAKITEDIMHRVKNNRYNCESYGGWYENIPRKAVDILIEHGWYVKKDPVIPDRYAVMFRNADVGKALDWEEDVEYLDDEDYEVEYEES